MARVKKSTPVEPVHEYLMFGVFNSKAELLGDQK
jgi:hypothetical protein